MTILFRDLLTFSSSTYFGTSFAFLVISKEKCLTIFGHPLDISTTVYGFGGLYSRKMEEEVGSIRGVITIFS